MIASDKVREVAERISIVDVIGEYVSLKRSGANFTGLCPFHGEKTPSFNVNPAREIFHCFGCGAGGDVFAFVMRLEGISFPDAVHKLAQRAGVTIEDRPLTPAELRSKGERDEQRAILELAARHYRETLTRRPEGAAGRSYLQQREVDPETAAAYGLGYAPERRDTLVHALRGAGHSLEAAAVLGLVRNGERGNWYDLLHNRLIFPIRDSQGHPIAFAGRVLDHALPKYINSPESPLYRKSSVLFGLDLALREIRLASCAIVVEGYFDHLALYRAGVKNVVATCGTALTDGHITLLKKHGDRVYLLFDSDNAGRKATVRAMELCLEQKLPAYVITLPQGEDPDSFLQQHGAESFQQRVADAKPAFEQYLSWLLTKTP
ncbi:MAG: DNA primase, partial [Elusimicrobiales bacterium]